MQFIPKGILKTEIYHLLDIINTTVSNYLLILGLANGLSCHTNIGTFLLSKE